MLFDAAQAASARTGAATSFQNNVTVVTGAPTPRPAPVHELPETDLPCRVVRAVNDNSPAVWGIKRACGIHAIPIEAVGVNVLDHPETDLTGLPIGPAEFVHAVMRARCIRPPDRLSYPETLMPLLGRRLWRSTRRMAHGSRRPIFIKPVHGNPFAGYVADSRRWAIDYTPHNWQQERLLRALPESTPLWCSEPVRFVSERRYFVLEGQVIGSMRTDCGYPSAPTPDEAVLAHAIELMAKELSTPVGYAITLGVLEDGMTVLVGVNDVYRLGAFPAAVPPTDYLRLLWARWRQIRRDSVLVDVRDQLIGRPGPAKPAISNPVDHDHFPLSRMGGADPTLTSCPR